MRVEFIGEYTEEINGDIVQRDVEIRVENKIKGYLRLERAKGFKYCDIYIDKERVRVNLTWGDNWKEEVEIAASYLIMGIEMGKKMKND